MPIPGLRKPSAAEALIIRESLAKLVEADKELKANETQIVTDMQSMADGVVELQKQHDDLIPLSQELTQDMTVASQGRTTLERQLNRQSAEQLAAQKKSIDRTIVDLKLRINEIKDARTALEKTLLQLRESRNTLGSQMDKLKEILGDDRDATYASL
jgi:chromosome segregation ATPase